MDNNEKTNIKKISKSIASDAFTLFAILFGYQYYGVIAEYPYLTYLFYAACILGVCLLFWDIAVLLLGDIKEQSKKIDRVINWMKIICIAMFLVCMCLGVVCYIKDSEVKVIFTEGKHDESLHADSSENAISRRDDDGLAIESNSSEDGNESSIEASITPYNYNPASNDDSIGLKGYSGGAGGFIRLLDGRSLYLLTASYGYSIEIINSTQRPIEFRCEDAVSVDLLEFIAYKDLEFEEPLIFSGGDDVYYPKAFSLQLSGDLGLHKAMMNADEKIHKDGYFTVAKDDIDKFSITTFLQDEGYYRFCYVVTYYKNGEKHTMKSPECECVCIHLNTLSKDFDEWGFKKK